MKTYWVTLSLNLLKKNRVKRGYIHAIDKQYIIISPSSINVEVGSKLPSLLMLTTVARARRAPTTAKIVPTTEISTDGVLVTP